MESGRAPTIAEDVRIESAPGHGACVTLTAPRQPLAGHEGGAGGKGSTKGTTEGDEEAMGRIRILLADDHAIVRKGLVLLLQDQPDLVVVGEADDGREAVEMARALRPDVVLMDLAMPHMDGVEATRLIAAEMPEIRVVGLSMYDDREKEELMRRAGARAYIAKGGPPSALFAAIRGDGRL